MDTLQLILAVGAALPGAALALWALATDRLRGGHRRPRCPGCWYSLEGLTPPARCPECGRDIRTERAMHRARVRRAPFYAGLMAAFGGLLTSASIKVPPSLLPTWALVALFTPDAGPYDPVQRELTARHADGTLSAAAHDRLFDVAERALTRVWPEMLPPLADSGGSAFEAPCYWIVAHPDAARRHTLIASFLAAPDRPEQSFGLFLLRWEAFAHRPLALPEPLEGLVLGILRDDAHGGSDASLFFESIGCRATPEVAALLVARAADADRPYAERGSALMALAGIAGRGDADLTPHLPALRTLLEPDSPALHHAAFFVAEAMGPAAAPLAPRLRELAADPVFEHARLAEKALDHIEPTP